MMSLNKKEKTNCPSEDMGSLIKRFNDFVTSRNDCCDEIPENPKLSIPYCFTNSSLEDIKKKYSLHWKQNSGNTLKYFTKEGKTVHKINNEFQMKRHKESISVNDIYSVTFAYNYYENRTESGKQLWRRLAEIKKYDNQEFSLTVVEFYEKSPEEAERKRRKRKEQKSTATKVLENENPTNSQTPHHLQNNCTNVSFEIPGTSDQIDSILMEMNNNPNLSGICDNLCPDMINLNTLSIEESSSCDRDKKKTCYSGDVADHSNNEPKSFLNSDNYDPENIQSVKGLYLSDHENLGPINVISKEGNKFIAAEQYTPERNSEWRRLFKQPHLNTMLWSCPYAVPSNNLNHPFVMLSLENYNDPHRDNKKTFAQQFKIKMKLIDCDLNQSVDLPCKLRIEAMVNLSADSEEYTSPVSHWVTLNEVDQYGLEMLVPFPDNPGDKFPRIWIIVHD